MGQDKGAAPRGPEKPPIIVLQCAGCHSILSDTLRYYVTSDASKQTITVSEARLISVAEEQLLSKSGWDEDCCFQLMSCSTCSAPLGRIYSMITRGLELLANNYTFASSALVSYQLGSIEMAAPDAAAKGGRDSSTHGPGTDRGPRGIPPVSAGGYADSGEAVDGLPALRTVVSELDGHVEKLTTATNQCTSSHRRISHELKEAKAEALSMNTKIQEYEATMDKMQNLLIKWEDRFGDLERRADVAENQFLAKATLEKRFADLERIMTAAKDEGAHNGFNEPAVRPPIRHGRPGRNSMTLSDSHAFVSPRPGDVAVQPLSEGVSQERNKRARSGT